MVISELDACEAKHRLLYFDIRYLECLMELLQAFMPQDAQRSSFVLANLKRYYQTIDVLFDAKIPSDWLEVDKALERHLGQAYRERRRLEKHWQTLNQQYELTELAEKLEAAELALDSAILWGNHVLATNNASNRVDSKCRILEQTLTALRHTPLPTQALPTYSPLYSSHLLVQQARILCLSDWLEYLNQMRGRLSQTATLSQILALKKLLIDDKSQHYLRFYQADWQSLACQALKANANINASTLQQTEQNLQQTIARVEQSLQHASLGLDGLSYSIRLWSTSFYVQLAQVILPAMQAAALRQGVGLQLYPVYQTIFTHLAAGSFLMIDVLHSRFLSPSYTLLQALSQRLLYDVPKLLNYGRTIGLQEHQVIAILPALQWSIGLFLQLGLAGTTLSMHPGLAVNLILAYTLGSASAALTQRLFSSRPGSLQHATINSLSYLGGAYAGQLVAQHTKAYITHTWLVPDADSLLANSRLCQQYEQACRQSAIQQLGLSGDATWKQVQKRIRHLAQRYHPDVNPAHYGLFRRNNQAKARLQELMVLAPRPG